MILKLNREIHFVRFVFTVILVELLSRLGSSAVCEYVKCDVFRLGCIRLLDDDFLGTAVLVIRDPLREDVVRIVIYIVMLFFRCVDVYILFLRLLEELFVCLMENVKQNRVFSEPGRLLLRSVFPSEGKELINCGRVVLRNLVKELINGILQVLGCFGSFRTLISEKIVEKEILFGLLVFINGQFRLFVAFGQFVVSFVVLGLLFVFLIVRLFVLSLFVLIGFVGLFVFFVPGFFVGLFIFFVPGFFVGIVLKGNSDFSAFGSGLGIGDTDRPRLLVGL